MSTHLATTAPPTDAPPTDAPLTDVLPTDDLRIGGAPTATTHLRPGDGRDPQDRAAVRRIFRATFVVGAALPAELPAGLFDAYERLCLDWYLTHGTVLLAERDGEVVGYLLACLDETAHRRWLRRAVARWLTVCIRDAAAGRLDGTAAAFVRARLHDGWRSVRHAPRPPVPAHAHVNLVRTARAGRTGRALALAMDELVRTAGLPGWYAEMNVPPGRSLAAIERAGSAIIHRQPSATFSALLGVPVERVTLARIVATAAPATRAPLTR